MEMRVKAPKFSRSVPENTKIYFRIKALSCGVLKYGHLLSFYFIHGFIFSTWFGFYIIAKVKIITSDQMSLLVTKRTFIKNPEHNYFTLANLTL